jgi:uncharacterized protein (DUF885 family)
VYRLSVPGAVLSAFLGGPRLRRIALTISLAAGCAAQSGSLPPAKDAAEKLRSIGDRYWEALLATTTLEALNQNGVGYLGGPLYATSIGDHRFDGKLDDLSPEAQAALTGAMRGLRDELERVPAAELRGEEAFSYEILREQLRDAVEAAACKIELWLVDPQNGPQTQLAQTAQGYRNTPADRKALANRLSQAPRYFAQVAGNLRGGLAQGLVSPRANVVRVIEQLDSLLSLPRAESPFLPPEGREEVEPVLASAALPALTGFRDFLREEILPRSRPGERLGLWALPEGGECYSFLVRRHTGGTRTPEALHQLGLEQLRSIEEEALRIAHDAGHPSIESFRAALKADRSQFKSTREELLAFNRELLARTIAALPEGFADPVLLPLEVRAVEQYREASFTAGYYQPPAGPDTPGIYYVNTYQSETRPLFNIEPLLFHEAVPGHHLQGSAMLGLRGLPEYRREFGPTAYIEGWALYSERMSDEALHLYSGPKARFGMLGYQAWRAARLVVDTGMHALRWDREKCVKFLTDHTTLPRLEAEAEIDRYAASPAQALGYMIGELEIYRLRREAEKRLGAKFDLRGFHAAVLRHGPVSMATLARIVGGWVAQSARP